MKFHNSVSYDRLNELLRYDPATGNLYWRAASKRKKGLRTPAGTDRYGYRTVMIDYLQYPAQRLVWFLHHKEWPAGMVDHINGNKTDNRINNLRIATYSQNAANARLHKMSSASGRKGVTIRDVKYRAKYRARIMINYRSVCLGDYESIEEAAAAYDRAARKIHGEFARAKE